MEINLKAGEVNVIYSDYLNKVVKEAMIQLTDTVAVKYSLNKDKNCMDMSIINTLLEDVDQGGEVNKDEIAKIITAQKSIFVQLT
ncbi:hypothetical protein [Clostridium beijerinckii]|uniref:hypothetical protein n=1 Tax=Clostridium beijerinckii TaxID=1520 RepID=UPI00156DB8AD|nr:hypothetical protein [Clostridium beijerinckii]NRU52550.1 hypothetical protein [Clostridium beijerinckii]NYC69273.1 hypothetical protein [Clostridium beijerinckii]NYC91751.1 hypothetical protein [Clostridium beijerinckii]